MLEEEKTKLMFLNPQALDNDAYLEDTLISEEQDRILYQTILISIIFLILNYFAW